MVGGEGQVPGESLECLDWEGDLVAHGSRYTPDGDSPCEHCLCDNGEPTNCVMTSCAPPPCTNYVQVKGQCCQVECQDEEDGGGSDEEPDRVEARRVEAPLTAIQPPTDNPKEGGYLRMTACIYRQDVGYGLLVCVNRMW